jgi:hypothetical protein
MASDDRNSQLGSSFRDPYGRGVQRRALAREKREAFLSAAARARHAATPVKRPIRTPPDSR